MLEGEPAKMKHGVPGILCRLPSVLIGFSMLIMAGAATAKQCASGFVTVGTYRLWEQTAGRGVPAVVFESGGGDDSSVWAAIEPEVQKLGVRTIVYDRAGLGRSDPAPGAYRIEHEAEALERLLDSCGVDRPIVLVAHSYGGFVTTLVAAHDPRVAGIVFVDANLPAYFDDSVLAALAAEYTPQFDALQRARPKLAAVMIPMMKAYPDTVKSVRAVQLPANLPVIDIVAENSWAKTPEQAEAMRRAHADFVKSSPSREAIVARGSSHYVMKDQPDLVIAAIKRMVERVRSAEN